MDTRTVGMAGLRGWRTTVANGVAGPVARRSPFSEDQVRTLVGVAFLVLAAVYLAGATRDLVRSR